PSLSSTLSLPDALPIYRPRRFIILKGRLALPQRRPHHPQALIRPAPAGFDCRVVALLGGELLEERQRALQQLLAQPVEVGPLQRSEEHTSELQSRGHLV